MHSVHWLRAFNLFYFSLLAVFISFLPVYLPEQGMSKSEMGFMIGTGSLIGVISQPLWGLISDRKKTIKNTMLVILALSAITGVMLFQSHSFLFLFVGTCLLYFFLLPVDPLTESLNVQTAELKKVSYGTIRMFGALGYGLSSLVVGTIMHVYGEECLAWMFLILALIAIGVCALLEDAPRTSKPVTLERLIGFFSVPQTFRLFLLIFITGLPQRINDTFMGVYIKELGGGADLVGQAWFVNSTSEILVFALSAWWLRPGKEHVLLSVAAILYAVRFMLSAGIHDPKWFVLIQVLQAFTFAFFYSAAVQVLYRMVPEEWRVTGQTALAMIFFGVSGIAASYAGGLLYEAFGGRTLYLLMAALSALAFLYSLTFHKKSSR